MVSGGAPSHFVRRILLKRMDAPLESGRHYGMDGPSDRAGCPVIKLLSFLTLGKWICPAGHNRPRPSWSPGPTSLDSGPPAITTGSNLTKSHLLRHHPPGWCLVLAVERSQTPFLSPLRPHAGSIQPRTRIRHLPKWPEHQVPTHRGLREMNTWLGLPLAVTPLRPKASPVWLRVPTGSM